MYWDENGVGYFLNPIPDNEEDTRQWKRFRDYDEKNPHIWEAFEKITDLAVERGYWHIGASFIGNIIRWERPEVAEGDLFKVNNDFFPYYARKYMKKHPKQRKLFEVRRLRAV